jgi:hypothetical protein
MNSNQRRGYRIHVTLYGDRFVSPEWVHHFMALAERLESRLATRHTHFSCGHHHGKHAISVDGAPVKIVDMKQLRYIPRNMEKIRALLAAPSIQGIELLCAERGADLTRDAICDIFITKPHIDSESHYHLFHFYVAADLLAPALAGEDPAGFFCSLVRQVDSDLLNVRYGLIQPMASEKRGGVYFIDLHGPGVTPTEHRNLNVWLHGRTEYQRKVRGVYWGNLITDEHLGRRRGVILGRLAKIIGEKSLVEIAPGKYFFTLPLDILRFGDVGLRRETERIEELFSSYGLLMHYPAVAV